MKKENLLIIEDEKLQREILEDFLKKKGYHVLAVENLKEAEKILQGREINLILLDWRLPDGDGLSFLETLKSEYPLIPVIMITAFASIEHAVTAMKKGAYHYLAKPVNLEELLLLVERALNESKLTKEVYLLKERLKYLSREEFQKVEGIIAESPAMQKVLTLVNKVAETQAPVLITGESGTGKEVIAKLLHQLSPRHEGPFIKINCAAIPETLLEAELFGYEKGAFTGAIQSKPGLFELAEGGTLFLDEIGEMPLSLQAKLLRVLQDNTFRRLGSLRELTVNLRLVTATNRDLQKMIKDALFREDLYWRLNVINIHIPPLRERKEDILPLAKFFIEKFNKKYGKEVKELSKEALSALFQHSFPGNVRELENRIERGIILAEGAVLTREDLGLGEETSKKGWVGEDLWNLPLEEAVERLEKSRIKEAMEKAKGVKVRAAEILGITERMLRYKLEKYGLGG
ncbi:acetoacetate metabolism regulatory protein AtoC [Caldimicrobium thiodismutans]|uniref:Acetoacetate metabolism regulatory protein AtoC n=1 Tax=Caldimicrobium thiodismutans TaxID=1653476 RepID=A0A0U4VZS4_9BACT|nr:sigma-54 dependent transcriptional regulator [Caldimicrobium thiodismutans]BAU22413.1 acetoacetate metabolism regulatory protein AtoC [Caldimicrobium thiodismutans]